MARSSTTPVSCSMRSARVDLPWSMCAMMQKFRMSSGGVKVVSANVVTRGILKQVGCGHLYGPMALRVRVGVIPDARQAETWCSRSMSTPHQPAPPPQPGPHGIERVFDRAFGHPAGALGRLGGWVMARGNAVTEHRMVELARIEPDETVLVIGPGPGVGLHAAALLAGHAVGVDPSPDMLALSHQRCGKLLLSAHEKWLPVSRHVLADEAAAAGFADLQTWTWDPPGFTALAAQLR